MTIRRFNPEPVHPPVGHYSHASEVIGPSRWLYVSGQVGLHADGTLAEGIAAQTEQALANLRAVLEDAGMDFENIVKMTVLLTDPAHIPEAGAVRARILGEVKPSATLMIVAGLAGPDLLVEIEAIAAA